jgi:anaerobic dimethyl sulfoxide reductase subunit C (anchor subunit)
MEPRDWALITFTILSHMSFGAFFVLWIIHAITTPRVGVVESDRMTNGTFLGIVVIQALALIASLFHLGTPFRAYLSVIHFGSSWLSREVVFAIAFFLVAGLYAILQWSKATSRGFRNFLAIIAILLGIGMVFSMSRIYMIPTEPSWDTYATMVSFYTTAFLLGTLLTGVGLTITHRLSKAADESVREERARTLRQILGALGIVAIVFLGIEFVVTPLYASALATGSIFDIESAKLLLSKYGVVFGARLFLAFLGAGIFGMLIYGNASRPEWQKKLGNLTYAAFGIVLVAEVMGRFLFYALRVRLGLP